MTDAERDDLIRKGTLELGQWRNFYTGVTKFVDLAAIRDFYNGVVVHETFGGLNFPTLYRGIHIDRYLNPDASPAGVMKSLLDGDLAMEKPSRYELSKHADSWTMDYRTAKNFMGHAKGGSIIRFLLKKSDVRDRDVICDVERCVEWVDKPYTDIEKAYGDEDFENVFLYVWDEINSISEPEFEVILRNEPCCRVSDVVSVRAHFMDQGEVHAFMRVLKNSGWSIDARPPLDRWTADMRMVLRNGKIVIRPDT